MHQAADEACHDMMGVLYPVPLFVQNIVPLYIAAHQVADDPRHDIIGVLYPVPGQNIEPVYIAACIKRPMTRAAKRVLYPVPLFGQNSSCMTDGAPSSTLALNIATDQLPPKTSLRYHLCFAIFTYFVFHSIYQGLFTHTHLYIYIIYV